MFSKKHSFLKRPFEISQKIVDVSGQIIGMPVFGYLFLGMSIFYSFVLIFYGVDFSDSFYHLNNFRDVKLASMSGFTSLIGVFWMRIFGNHLLSFRILNLLLVNLAVIIPFIFFAPKFQKAKSFILLGVSIVLLSTLNTNIFNYDSVTLFLLSFTSVWIIKYHQTGKKTFLFAYGFFSILLILARFPNIVILPLSTVLLAIIEYQKEKKDKKHFLIKFGKVISFYLFVCVILFALLLIFLYGNINEFFPRILNSILGIGKHYSLRSMVWRDLNDFMQIFQYIAVIVLLVYFSNRIRGFSKKYKYISYFLIFILFSLFLLLSINIRIYNRNLSLFYSAMCFSLIFHYASNFIRENKNVFLIIASIIFVFSIIPSMGSNTGLLKSSLFLICYLPFLLLYQKEYRKLSHKTTYALLSLLVLFSIYTRIENVYEDSSIINLNCELRNQETRYIHTTKVRCNFIDDVLSCIEIEKSKNNPVLLYGRVSHIFYYLTNIKPLYRYSFFMPINDPHEIARVEEVVKTIKPVIFLLTNYPDSKKQNSEINQKNNTSFDDLLFSHNYRVSLRNKFKIYYPE